MSDGAPHEIVIIKRVSSGHEDEHHGGVWKIAFADFMTAMMAFFLVMWLISANDKTKAVIARYFNPVQLVDSTRQPKGLEDPKEGAPSIMPKKGTIPDAKPSAEKSDAKEEVKGEDQKGAAAGKPSATTDRPGKHDEGSLFKDPYAVLTEIAGKADDEPLRDKAKALSDGEKGGSGAVGLKGGAAYRDPFEPLPTPSGSTDPNSTPKWNLGRQAEADTPSKPAAAAAPDAAAQADHPAPTVDPKTKPPSPTTPAKDGTSLEARLEAAVNIPAAGRTSGAVPKLDVKHTGEGTVIDLTDGVEFAMFGSASAEPSPKMVRVMERIGRILKESKGRITIRGFTDSRPFRSETYDNWRLSSARAHMAHYMLVRGGVDEQRFERIEGVADRQPKNPKDPQSPENRRIEILVRNAE